MSKDLILKGREFNQRNIKLFTYKIPAGWYMLGTDNEMNIFCFYEITGVTGGAVFFALEEFDKRFIEDVTYVPTR